MTEEKYPKMEDEIKTESGNDVLTLDDLESNFISNPKVGEEVDFKIVKVRKLTGDKLWVRPKDKKPWSKGLSNVDYGIEIDTQTGAVYTVPNWEVWGKLKAIFKKLGKMSDITVRISHEKNGRIEEQGTECYKIQALVGDTFKTLSAETREWIE